MYDEGELLGITARQGVGHIGEEIIGRREDDIVRVGEGRGWAE